MDLLASRVTSQGNVLVAHTGLADGDLSLLAVPRSELAARRRELIDRPWQVLSQVHSDRVIRLDSDTPPATRPPAGDALVAASTTSVLAAHSADCVTLALSDSSGCVAAVHAGWRGLLCGVIESTLRTMRNEGSGHEMQAVIGPHIGPCCYEFGAAELAQMVRRFGKHCVATSDRGTPALDLAAAVRHVLAVSNVDVVAEAGRCTGCDDGFWSHRVGSDRSRQALLTWVESGVRH